MHSSDCCQFSYIHISQGSVATYLRCGGIFKYEFVANLQVSLPVKEFWKSVNIWGSYGRSLPVLTYLPVFPWCSSLSASGSRNVYFDLSLITMHISDCCQFSDIHISQGSVATYLRCGGIFKYEFVANLQVSLPNRSFVNRAPGLVFLRHSVHTYIAGKSLTSLNENLITTWEIRGFTWAFPSYSQQTRCLLTSSSSATLMIPSC